MGNIIGYLIIALLGVLVWEHNWGVKIIDVGRDWPVVLILVGVWGIIREIFKNRKSPPKP
ncbi:MAG: hypothetical protein ABIL67_07050 [candidate division WOR-3 bacterium]